MRILKNEDGSFNKMKVLIGIGVLLLTVIYGWESAIADVCENPPENMDVEFYQQWCGEE